MPNDLAAFVAEKKTIKKIVINSKASAGFLKKHFKDTWLKTGNTAQRNTTGLTCCVYTGNWKLGNKAAEEVFGKVAKQSKLGSEESRELAMYVLESTSPAHATKSRAEKEAQWLELCYGKTTTTTTTQETATTTTTTTTTTRTKRAVALMRKQGEEEDKEEEEEKRDTVVSHYFAK